MQQDTSFAGGMPAMQSIPMGPGAPAHLHRKEIVRVKNLYKKYTRNADWAVKNVSF